MAEQEKKEDFHIVRVEKLEGSSRFLSFYKLYLERSDGHGGVEKAVWSMSSRQADPAALECVNGKQNVNAVCIIPSFVDKDGDLCYVVISEKRYPLNDVCYAFPAGLVEKGEPSVGAAVRELGEETGIEVDSKLVPYGEVTYTSEGMTDETLQTFEVFLGELKISKQQLQELETQIGVHFVKAKDIPEFMKGKKWSDRAAKYLLGAYRLYEMEKAHQEQLAKQEETHEAERRTYEEAIRQLYEENQRLQAELKAKGKTSASKEDDENQPGN